MEVIEDGDNVIGASTSAGPSTMIKGDVTRGAGRKKVKGPNPLSVKRKKGEPGVKRSRDEDQDGRGDDEAELGDTQDISEKGQSVKGETDEAEAGKRRKKRKRGKGKSAVAEARAELMGELQAGGVINGSASGGSDDE